MKPHVQKKGAGWFELLYYFRWFFFSNVKQENGVSFEWEGDWEDMKGYFSSEINLGKWNDRLKRRS